MIYTLILCICVARCIGALILLTPTSLYNTNLRRICRCLRSIQVLLTDRFTEGLMLLRNIFGWHLIDLSYIALNETNARLGAGKKRAQKKGFEDHRPTFDELSVQVPHIPYLVHTCVSLKMLFTVDPVVVTDKCQGIPVQAHMMRTQLRVITSNPFSTYKIVGLVPY